MAEFQVDVDPQLLHVLSGHYTEPPGYGCSRRQGSRSWLIILTKSGQGVFRHRDGEFTTWSGDVVLLRPFTPHEYRVAPSAPHWELQWAHFNPRPHWEQFLSWTTLSPGVSRVSVGESLEQISTALTRVIEANDELISMPALEEALVRCWRATSATGEMAQDPRIRKAMSMLTANLHETIAVAELADHVGLSVSRFSHLFQSETGTSPRAFRERYRMQRALQLLEHTGRTVKQIAVEVGYESEFYFSNRFRHLMGMSPTDWRRKSPKLLPKQ